MLNAWNSGATRPRSRSPSLIPVSLAKTRLRRKLKSILLPSGLPAPATRSHRATADSVADAVTVTSQYEDFYRQETGWSGLLYKSPNAKYVHRLARLDLATSCDMRAPSAATAVYALECAMDELAIALKIDPVELRLRCYSDRDQHEDRPFSSKALRECYRQGAEAFGWNGRSPEPRSMRDGSDLVGWGMATGVWEAMQMPIAVRIVLTSNGHAEVACATSDIGTGTYTIMAQVAADMLGLPIDNISIKLGNSSLPQSPVEGGSWIAASVANGIATTAHRAGCNNQPLPGRFARSQHTFGNFCRGEDRRAAWGHPRHARRQRGRSRSYPEHEDRK